MVVFSFIMIHLMGPQLGPSATLYRRVRPYLGLNVDVFASIKVFITQKQRMDHVCHRSPPLL